MRALPVYPFLLAVYPVFALASQNVYERIRPGELAFPLGASLYVSLLFWALAGWGAKESGQRALITGVAVGLFFGYSVFFRFLRSVSPSVAELLSIWLLLGEAIVVLVVALVLRRRRWRLVGLTIYLNTVSSILLLLALVQALMPRVSPDRIVVDLPPMDRAASVPTGDVRPDVLVVILDSYSGSPALKRYYGFDNSTFEKALTARGFIVPAAARSNYSHTFQALASMLNARYVEPELAQIDPKSNDKSLLDPLVETHALWAVLKSRGYRFVFFPTHYAITSDNRNADLKLPAPSETSSEFALVWVRMTPVIPLARSLCRRLGCSVALFDYTPEPARRISWKLDQVQRVIGDSMPSFVFLHLMVPHEPFVFDAMCEPRDVYWPQAYPAAESLTVRAAYIAQVRCVNQKMLLLADQVLIRTNGEAIIILQADHGYGQLGRGPDSYGNASIEQIDERTHVLGAYYLPDRPVGLIHDSITPVNVFRAMLRHYFRVDLPPLDDKVYFSTHATPYQLHQVR